MERQDNEGRGVGVNACCRPLALAAPSAEDLPVEARRREDEQEQDEQERGGSAGGGCFLLQDDAVPVRPVNARIAGLV